jgi:hypothetical protein
MSTREPVQASFVDGEGTMQAILLRTYRFRDLSFANSEASRLRS